jgi:hypothetical protein
MRVYIVFCVKVTILVSPTKLRQTQPVHTQLEVTLYQGSQTQIFSRASFRQNLKDKKCL